VDNSQSLVVQALYKERDYPPRATKDFFLTFPVSQDGRKELKSLTEKAQRTVNNLK
jgi:hypothetical protein